MIPTFVIFLREGIEASMIVAILLAYLDQSNQRRHFRDVYLGVAAALVLVVAGGVAAYLFIHRYEGSNVQTIFETLTYLVAAVALTYMTFWMSSHARTLKADLQRRSDEALSKGTRTGLGVLAFTAVGREGLETMVFTLAIIFASQSQAATTVTHVHATLLIVGAALGLFVALCIAYSIYKLGRRLNLRLFFRVLGITLMIFAAGLLADAVENLQQLGWLPFGERVLWDSSREISEASSIGDVFHSLLGYADRPTVLQVVVWVTYLAIALTLFVRSGRTGTSPRRADTRRPPAAASTPPAVASDGGAS